MKPKYATREGGTLLERITNAHGRTIKLPVASLLQQFKSSSHPLIRHFDLVYAQQGLDRLPESERGDLLPDLVQGISRNSDAQPAHAGGFFNVLLRVLPDHRFPTKGSNEDDSYRETLKLSDADAQYLSHWLGKLLLLRSQSEQSAGLSVDEQSLLTLQNRPETWNPSAAGGLNLTESKIQALKLVSSGAFTDEERFFPALYAAADANSRISSIGEDQLKRCLAHMDVEGQGMVENLYRIYLGSPALVQGQPMQVPPASPSLRIRLLSVLSKSTRCLQYPDRINAIVEKDLLDSSSGAHERRTRDVQSEKLRAGVTSFLNFAVRTATKTQLASMSEELLPKLVQVVEASRTSSPSVERSLNGRIFEVLGLMASSSKHIVTDPQLSFLQWLFRCLGEEDDRNVVVSIDEAISATLRPFEELSQSSVQDHLAIILLGNMKKEYRNQRNIVYATLRFANRCLPFQSVIARWIDMRALAGAYVDSHEVIEEAKKGLDPYWLRLMNLKDVESPAQSAVPFPRFLELVKYIFEAGPVDFPLLKKAVPYCRHTLYAHALAQDNRAIQFTLDWDRKLDLAIAEDASTKAAIRRALENISASREELAAFGLLWNGLVQAIEQDETQTRAQLSKFAVELASLATPSFMAPLAESYQHLEQTLLSNDLEVGRVSAHLYGLLASNPAVQPASLAPSLTKLLDVSGQWRSAVGSSVNSAHGAILALSHYISRTYQRSGALRVQEPSLRVVRTDDGGPRQNTLESLVSLILAIATDSHDNTLLNAAFVGFAQLAQYRVISLTDIIKRTPLAKVVDALHKSAKASNERAIHALGALSLILDESGDEGEELQRLTDRIHELHEIRQPETQFSVGETLAIIACGWQASILRDRNDLPDNVPRGPRRNETGPVIIDRVLDDCSKTKPSLKKAAVIWALCLMQHGSDALVQDKLGRFQIAFKRCLSDRDELVQESAARGLGIVYERGGRELKDDLVRDLVGSFSSNRADMSGTITEDTQLFEPGALPTGDGSVSTYKDIMSLAAEVGDSSLVYRFMSLASTNAIWSSRAAFGRFGLSNVLSDSSVDGYLASNPKLYPKLFRYQFDPNSNVRKSMKDIWTALVKDPAATIDGHFEAIMDDLLVNIVAGRDWRARQASCSAIGDLVQGRKHEQIEPYLEQIWTLCFKVLDDIKESVRTAAQELARILSGILVRSLESAQGPSSAANQMLRRVLPFLVSTQGLESSAKEVQAFSISTLLDIINKAKAPTLRPFIPELIERLLGLLSTFEYEGFDTLYLNASKYKLKENQIDNARLQLVRGSPLMTAIERCIDVLDEVSMLELMPRLEAVLKSAVGMPTKVGCSRVMVSLCTRRSLLVRPHSDALLSMLQRRVVDRNETVSSSNAAAMGYLSRGASEEQLLATAEFAKTLYFDSEDESRQVVAGEIMHAMAKHATDRFSALASAMLPFVFVARHDESKRVRERFQETWDENVGGMRAASLYLEEILELVQAQLQSRRWGLKHAAALALAEAIEAIAATSHGPIGEGEATRVWPHLRTALAEKSWEGKEKILEAFAVMVAQAEALWRQDATAAGEVLKVSRRSAALQAPPRHQHDARGEMGVEEADQHDRSHCARPSDAMPGTRCTPWPAWPRSPASWRPTAMPSRSRARKRQTHSLTAWWTWPSRPSTTCWPQSRAMPWRWMERVQSAPATATGESRPLSRPCRSTTTWPPSPFLPPYVPHARGCARPGQAESPRRRQQQQQRQQMQQMQQMQQAQQPPPPFPPCPG